MLSSPQPHRPPQFPAHSDDIGAAAGEYGVLALVGPLMVLNAMHAIAWRDGSSLGICRVSALGRDTTFLRAVRGADTLWRVFDLRQACPGIERDWVRQRQADLDGLVFFSLRHRFECAGDLTEWVTHDLHHPHRAGADLGQALDARHAA